MVLFQNAWMEGEGSEVGGMGQYWAPVWALKTRAAPASEVMWG